MSERTDDATPLEHNGIERDAAIASELVDGGAPIAQSDDAVGASAVKSRDEVASSSGERIEAAPDTTAPGTDGGAADSSGDDAGDAATSSDPGPIETVGSAIVDRDSSDTAEPGQGEQASVGVEGAAGRTDAPMTSGGGEEPAASAGATVNSPFDEANSSGPAESNSSERAAPNDEDDAGVAGGAGETPLTSGRGAAAAGSARVRKAARATKSKEIAGSDDEVAEFTPEPLDDDEFRSALEAVLLIVDAPAPVELLADALQDKPVRVERALHEMAAELSARASGIDLRFVGDGWRFYTRSEYAPYVERMLLDGARSKLTRAALETLAVVAYRQPVTRTRVSAVRGVNVDGVMRTLLARGLIAEAGVDPETNGTQYCTTELFLERIGLASLSDLPPLAPLLPGVDLIDEINESLDTDPRYTRLRKSAETDLDLGTEED